MPTKPKRPCSKPGCRELTTGQYCEEHTKQVSQAAERARGSAHQRGYDSKWRKARAAYLSRHPLCKHCGADGLIVAATVVDHVIPHKGDKRLFWDSKNWQPLCKKHHDRKTATEDGGFGR